MKKTARKIRRVLLGAALCTGLFLLMLASPLGRVFDRAVSNHYNSMTRQYLNTGKLTWSERVQFIALYKAIAWGGYIISPEGSAIIQQYLWGDGRDLTLPAAYIRTSPVISKHLATMKIWETRRITFRMAEDYRLAVALNPLHLRKEKHRVVVWEHIVFAHDTTTYTRLEYGLGEILLLDAAVHTLRPRPFTARCTWAY